MENKSLATEIMTEIKATACRWKIAFFVMLGIEIVTLLLVFGQGVK